MFTLFNRLDILQIYYPITLFTIMDNHRFYRYNLSLYFLTLFNKSIHQFQDLTLNYFTIN